MNQQLVKLGVEDQPSDYKTSTGRSGSIRRKGACSDEFLFIPREGEEVRPRITIFSKKEGLQFLFDLLEGETIEIEYSTPGVLSLLPYYQSSVPFV